MEITLIGLLIVLIFGAVFIFFLTHRIIKVILFMLGFIIIASIILGVFIVMDAKQFQEKIEESQSLFILEDNGKILALIQIKDDNLEPNEEEETKIRTLLSQKDYKSLSKDYFKLLFVDIKVLDSISQKMFQVENYFNFSKEQARLALISDDPFQVLGIEENLMPAELTESKLKIVIFMSTIEGPIMDNPVFLLKEFKKGNIEVYKETVMFKFMRYIPTSLVAKLVDKAKDKIKIPIDT